MHKDTLFKNTPNLKKTKGITTGKLMAPKSIITILFLSDLLV